MTPPKPETAVGSMIGPYRVTGRLGRGGMGEVWEAEDARLDRRVALKLLPPDFAVDGDRHARFEREAKVLASLNHPNIATLYGLEHVGNTHGLVMELVEGEDLEQRLKRGAVPVDEAMAIAVQVAEALEAAHEAGVVHRDLKPANVMVRPDGTVKVLDFGLAKTWAAAEAASDLSSSPTRTSAGTVAGLIIGTAGYMAPEQAKGQPVDRRADIWAFGVLLWEMLAGRRLFAGESATEVIAAVLRESIPLEGLPARTPTHVTSLLGRCLDRDPKTRLQAIGEARIALASDQPSAAAGLRSTSDGDRSRWAWWVAAALVVVAALAVGWGLRRPEAPPPVMVAAEVHPPPNADFVFDGVASASLSVSPDGRWITFSAAESDGRPRIWVRPSGGTEARPFPGTEDGAFPFWSPDSREIAFFADRALWRIALDGPSPSEICQAPDGRGGTWGDDGIIVFSPMASGGLHRVPATGGSPVAFTELDDGAGEATHRWPSFLPDGRHVVFFVGGHGSTGMPGVNALWVVDITSGERRRLADSWSKGVFSHGHLLFGENGALVARPFDPRAREFTGPSTVVASDIGGSFIYAVTDFGVSDHDVLVLRAGDIERLLQLRWTDPETLEIGDPVGDPVAVDFLSISPDGRHLALAVTDLQTEMMDLWIHDLERDVRARLTFSSFQQMLDLAWSSDSRRIAYGVIRDDGSRAILVADIDSPGRSSPILERPGGIARPMAWTLDDTALLYVLGGALQSLDLGSGASEEIIGPEKEVFSAELAPDGRWLAYLAGDFGGMKPFVTDMEDPGRRWQISDEPTIALQWMSGGTLWMVSPGARLWRASFAVEGDTPVIGRVESAGDLPHSRNGTFSSSLGRGIVAFTVEGGGRDRSGDGRSRVRLLAGWTARLEAP